MSESDKDKEFHLDVLRQLESQNEMYDLVPLRIEGAFFWSVYDTPRKYAEKYRKECKSRGWLS